MTREEKIKRILFYLTVTSIILFPFTIDGGTKDNIIAHLSTVLVLGSMTVISFWGCTKKEFKKITGSDLFEEE